MNNKTTRDIKFFVLKHKLNSIAKTIHIKTKDHDFYNTEEVNYAHLDKAVKVAMFAKYPTAKAKTDRVIQVATRRARFLYSLPSKIIACKNLIQDLPGKTLVFGQDSKTLLDICPTAIVSENKNYVQDLADFKAGKTMLTCSNKILKQGENIPNLDNLILFAYYSKTKDFTQMVGRLRTDVAVGNIIIFVTSGTQEEVWFEKMTEELNVPFMYCTSIKQIIDKI